MILWVNKEKEIFYENKSGWIIKYKLIKSHLIGNFNQDSIFSLAWLIENNSIN
jgi:hypothetical protein